MLLKQKVATLHNLLSKTFCFLRFIIKLLNKNVCPNCWLDCTEQTSMGFLSAILNEMLLDGAVWGTILFFYGQKDWCERFLSIMNEVQ